MKRTLLDNIKNWPGWRTADRLVVLAFDDFGAIRLKSKKAWDRMSAMGLEINGRFDRLDTLETRQDVEALLEVLNSVSDREGRPAIATPYALCANPDFERMLKESTNYLAESLPSSFSRLAADRPDAYSGAWGLWKEGVSKGLLKPQFHGREHLNVQLIERKLRADDRILRASLENRSLVGIEEDPSMPGVGFTHAFGMWDVEEIKRHRDIIADGLRQFESIYGYPSTTFTPPALKLHPDLFSFVESMGVEAVDKPLHCVRRLDRGRVKRELNKLGIRPGQSHVTLVRNVVFEPTSRRNFDSVGLALSQVAAAFRWRKPAIISSHRVNFCGHIDPDNRKFGLQALHRLLSTMVRRWPDLQFLSADELVERIKRET